MNAVNIHEDRWIAIKIFLTVFLISNLFFKPNLSFARFVFLTKALTHDGATWIERVLQTSGIQCIDSFKLNSHTYIVATPGLSFIASASYLPYAVFLQSRFIHLFSLDPLLELKLSQFIMALSTVTLFTALLIAIFFLSLRKIGSPQKKAIIFSFLLYSNHYLANKIIKIGWIRKTLEKIVKKYPNFFAYQFLFVIEKSV